MQYGDFEVKGGTLGIDFFFDDSGDGVLTIKTSEKMIVRNINPDVATKNRIEVAGGVNADIILQGVNIDTSSSTPGQAAFMIEDNSTGNVNIFLDGTNKLKSGADCAGLQKNGESDVTGTLTISGGGSLEAIGGDDDEAGIGGSNGADGCNITIISGTITAQGGHRAAGIGGGTYGNGSNITIKGGMVTARGGGIAAGIGGGMGGSGSYITISGGEVFAQGGDAGIGGGVNGDGSNIEISGGKVTAQGGILPHGIGSGGGAGIGGGTYGNGSNITISGGIVMAKSRLGAGIGGGYKGYGYDRGKGNNITISGGSGSATCNAGAQKIGSGKNVAADGINNTVGGKPAPADATDRNGGTFTWNLPDKSTLTQPTATGLISKSPAISGKKWWIQSGNDAGDGMNINIDPMNTKVLGLTGLDVSIYNDVKSSKEPEPVRNKDESEADFNKRKAEWAKRDAARAAEWSEYEKTHAISKIDGALAYISRMRANIGAQQNRLEHTIANENNIVENTTAAESRIRDTDMAKEMAGFSLSNILAQAGESMLSQANASNQGVMTLLG